MKHIEAQLQILKVSQQILREDLAQANILVSHALNNLKEIEKLIDEVVEKIKENS